MVVVGDFGVITIQIWMLISFTWLGENIFGWSHSKEHKKKLSKAHEFCPVSFRNGATVISKITVKIVFSGV